MATSVDICNLALAQLGSDASVTSIKPPDGANAGHCARFYPMALRKLFEEFDWSFAQARVRLGKLNDIDTELYGFQQAYSWPSDAVKIVKIASAADADQNNIWHFPEQEIDLNFRTVMYNGNRSRMVLCNIDDAIAHYIAYIDSPSLFPTYFTQALVLLLASYLVGPIKRTDSASKMAQNLNTAYEAALVRAKSLDAQSARHKKNVRIPSNIKSRWV